VNKRRRYKAKARRAARKRLPQIRRATLGVWFAGLASQSAILLHGSEVVVSVGWRD
jgi:hypothetical protein